MAAKWKKSLHCGMPTTVRTLSSIFAPVPPLLLRQSNPYVSSVLTTSSDQHKFLSFVRFICDARGGTRGARSEICSKHLPSQNICSMSSAALSQVSGGKVEDKETKPGDQRAFLPTFITSDHLEGLELDTSSLTWTSLEMLIRDHKELCFEDHDSTKGLVYPAPFLTKILEKTHDDIMAFSMFWTIEQRLAGISCARMFFSDGISSIKNRHPNAPARRFLFTNAQWEAAYEANDFFLLDFHLTTVGFGQYSVIAVPVSDDWRDAFRAGFASSCKVGTFKKVFSRN